MKTLNILYEDNHLLVIDKPAGIATMGAESGPTVHSLAAEYLKQTYNKPGKAFVGIVSRLDTMTSGVLVLARTSKAASRLSEQFASKSEGVVKVYLAAVDPPLESESGEFVDWVRKDDQARRMRIVGRDAPNAKQAKLRYLTVGQALGHSVVAVQILTGRKHQIRVQFSDRGHPVVGDRKYRSQSSFPMGVALHSWQLQIIHPTRRIPLWFTANPPASWKRHRHLLANSERVWHDAKAFFGLSDGSTP